MQLSAILILIDPFEDYAMLSNLNDLLFSWLRKFHQSSPQIGLDCLKLHSRIGALIFSFRSQYERRLLSAEHQISLCPPSSKLYNFETNLRRIICNSVTNCVSSPRNYSTTHTHTPHTIHNTPNPYHSYHYTSPHTPHTRHTPTPHRTHTTHTSPTYHITHLPNHPHSPTLRTRPQHTPAHTTPFFTPVRVVGQ